MANPDVHEIDISNATGETTREKNKTCCKRSIPGTL
jgi:hypothetical protein